MSVMISELILDRSQFEELSIIGRGSYGVVKKVREKATKNLYALKDIFVDFSQSEEQKRFMREVSILASVKHPCVLPFKGYILASSGTPPAIVTDLMHGSLEKAVDDCVEGKRPLWLTETMKYRLLLGTAAAMSALHKQNIIHRDLKPGNILLTEENLPVVCDFGLSKFQNPRDAFSQSMHGGSPFWAAPEIISGLPFDYAVDTYAFGIIIYQIIVEKIPYVGFSTLIELLTFVNNGGRPIIPESVPQKVQELMEMCWNQDPKQRPTFDVIINLLLKKEYHIPGVKKTGLINYAKRIDLSHDEIPKEVLKPSPVVEKQPEVFQPEPPKAVPKVTNGNNMPKRSHSQKLTDSNLHQQINTPIVSKETPVQKNPYDDIPVVNTKIDLAPKDIKANNTKDNKYRSQEAKEKSKIDTKPKEKKNSIPPTNNDPVFVAPEPHQYAPAKQSHHPSPVQESPMSLFDDGCQAYSGNDFIKALECFEKAANQGHVQSQINLAIMYQKVIDRNYEKSFNWFRIAAESGDPNAKCGLAAHYHYGNGTNQDLVKAEKLYIEAKEYNCAEAAYGLGILYLNHQKDKKADYAKAKEYFDNAIRGNCIDGHCGLGILYENGFGVPLNISKAIEEYSKASFSNEYARSRMTYLNTHK